MDRTGRPVGDQRLLAESLALVTPVAGELIAAFYDRLFADHPALRPMFPPVIDAQRDRLLAAIIGVVTHYDRPQQLVPALTAMGGRHGGYGVRIDHYAAVGLTLVDTLRRFAGPAWTPEYEGAWLRAYTYAAGVMMQAGAIGAEPATEVGGGRAAA